jgi:hypothetical protein
MESTGVSVQSHPYCSYQISCFVGRASRYIYVIKTTLTQYWSSVYYRQSTSTCFGQICSPSSGGKLHIYNNWYVLCFLVDCLLAGLWIYTWTIFNFFFEGGRGNKASIVEYNQLIWEKIEQWAAGVRGSVHHGIIHTEIANKMQQYQNLLFHIYMNLNIFWAIHRPLSGAQNCSSILWFCIR